MPAQCKVTLSHQGHKLGRPSRPGTKKHESLHKHAAKLRTAAKAKAKAKKASKAKLTKHKALHHKHTTPTQVTCIHHQRGRPKGSRDKQKRKAKTR